MSRAIMRYYRWPSLAAGILFIVIFMILSLLHWQLWLIYVVSAAISVLLGVLFLQAWDHIELRRKALEQVRQHPEAGTIEFEHDGKIYRGIVTTEVVIVKDAMVETRGGS